MIFATKKSLYSEKKMTTTYKWKELVFVFSSGHFVFPKQYKS